MVDACTSQLNAVINAHSGEAVLGGADGGRVPAGPATDDRHVELLRREAPHLLLVKSEVALDASTNHFAKSKLKNYLIHTLKLHYIHPII